MGIRDEMIHEKLKFAEEVVTAQLRLNGFSQPWDSLTYCTGQTVYFRYLE